jgi:DnaJ-class molecular chaperone
MAAQSENFYSSLGVNKEANQDDIKRAYRTLSMKWHPDRNNQSNESTEKFQQISRAYETLSDIKAKKQYDMALNNPFASSHINPDDLFSMFFGGGGREGVSTNIGPDVQFFSNIPNFRNAMQKPSPIIKNITISISQAFNGCKIPITIERWITNQHVKKHEQETLYITIPKGIDDNEIIVAREKGNIINDTFKGDVKIFIKVNNNSRLIRRGLDLIYKKTITLKEALCGFSFDLEYIDDRKFKINNKQGNIIVPNFNKQIPKMGMERDGQKGSLIILFSVKFPETLPKETIVKLENLL